MNEAYLNPMTQLEHDYQGVMFVYMTCHLDGTGTEGNLNLRNEQIRNHCATNNKILSISQISRVMILMDW